MSPELLHPKMAGLKICQLTKESDCYALGMVIYEVLSGQMPFASYAAPVVIRKVLNGKRPKRPEGNDGKLFTDSIWEVVQRCWKPRPRDRISARDALQGLAGDVNAEPGGNDEWNSIRASDCTFSPLYPRLIFDSPCAA
jgi:hypothetical protein